MDVTNPPSLLLPVILSGGAGTRLWPASSELHPKPFLRLPDGESLLEKTYRRAAALPGVAEILTVTHRDLLEKTRDEIAAAGLARLPHHFILEPARRNTAPALAVAAAQVKKMRGADALMLVLPADHLIADAAAFARAVAEAAGLAGGGKIVAFGIAPTRAETGYGYIEAEGNRALRFVEKPDAAQAASYVASGKYLWNAGMFCFRAGVFMKELALHAPDIAALAEECLKTAIGAERIQPDGAVFEKFPNLSIDYALMEKSKNITVVACDIGWSDIGTWSAMSQVLLAAPPPRAREVHRPWGVYTVVEEGHHYKIKRIVVRPGAALSLQLHHRRSEHWTVVSGKARVTLEGREFDLKVNESAFIPVGRRHRLANPGAEDLMMIEVQVGEYLGEDDIVRFDDDAVVPLQRVSA